MAREARVDAPLSGSPLSSAQVSVLATPPGCRRGTGPWPPGVVLKRGAPSARRPPACCRPGSGVRRDRLCPRAFGSLLAGLLPAPPAAVGGRGALLRSCTLSGFLAGVDSTAESQPVNKVILWEAVVIRGSKTVLRVPPRVCDFFVERWSPVLLHLMWFIMWPSLPLSCDFCGSNDRAISCLQSLVLSKCSVFEVGHRRNRRID